MIQPYFEVFYSLLEGETFRTLTMNHWSSLVTNCCLLKQSKLMGDNKKFGDSAILWGILLIFGGERFSTMKIHYWLSYLDLRLH